MAQVESQAIVSDAVGAGLCLHPPGCCPEGAACSTVRTVQVPTTIGTTTTPFPDHEKQASRRPLTIVYGDRACTVDVTEAQAMEILSTARLGAEQSVLATDGRPALAAGVTGSSGCAYPSGAALAQSMKGSLRRFLEKRTARLRDASGSPYSTAAKLLPPPSPLYQQGQQLQS